MRWWLDRITLAVAWVLLIGVSMYQSAQVSDLIETVDRDVTDTATRVCGAWLGTYQMLNLWATERLEPQRATEQRERFARDFRDKCPGYDQLLEGE